MSFRALSASYRTIKGMAILPPLRQRLTPNRSKRDNSPVDLIVVHRPVGSYQGSIDFLCKPEAQASAHIILAPKGLEATQLVPWGEKAWACVAFNSRSDNLEIADGAWDGSDPEAWRVAARIVAYRLKKRGLKPRWARGGNGAGFCRHYDLGSAGGSHTDPVTGMVAWLKFVARVKWEFYRGGFRDRWGIDVAPVKVLDVHGALGATRKKPKPVRGKPRPKRASGGEPPKAA